MLPKVILEKLMQILGKECKCQITNAMEPSTLHFEAQRSASYLKVCCQYSCMPIAFKNFIIHARLFFIIPYLLLCGCKVLQIFSVET